MALVTAKATGNWSAGGTWDSDPALPAAGDTVDCAGYTVTIDQNVTVATIKSTAAGYFAVSATRTITANILSDTGHSGGGVVRCTNGAGTTVTIAGSVTAGPSRGVDLTGAGTVSITGAVVGGSGSGAYGIYHNNASGVINVTLSVTGGSGNTARGAHNNSTGTVNITGDCTGGSNSQASAVYNNSSGTVNITGSVTGGSSTNAQGVNNASTGTVSIAGNATASATSNGAQNSSTGTMSVGGVCIPGASATYFALVGANSGGVTTYKKLQIGGNVGGTVAGYVKLAVDATVNYIETVRSDTGAAYKLSNNYPTNAQVESGVVFHLGTQTGTLAGGGGAVSISPWRGNIG